MNRIKLALGVIIALTLCLTVSCNKEKTMGQIKGIVIDANTNEPIQGVNISLNPTGLLTTTGSDGRYEFTNLEPGQYTVEGVMSGFENCTKNITVVAGNTSSGDMQLQPIGNVLISNGLFCYFDFDGDEIVDWTGNFTGLNAGAVASTDTPSGEGKSYQFDGVNSYILIQDNIVPTDNAFSINIWFKTESTHQALIGSDNHSGGNHLSALWILTNSKLRYYSDSYFDSWSTNGTISQYLDNMWHMMTLTYDGAIGMIYIDGSLFETKSGSLMAWGSNVHSTYLGTDETNYITGFFNGKLDNFRSYNRALTINEIQKLYEAKQ